MSKESKQVAKNLLHLKTYDWTNLSIAVCGKPVLRKDVIKRLIELLELVSVSNHSDNYYLAIATIAALLALFIKAAIVFAAAALIGKLFGIW